MSTELVTLNDLKAYHEAITAQSRGQYTIANQEILSRFLTVDLLAHAIALIEEAEETFQHSWKALKYADLEHDEERCADENHFLWCHDCLSYAASDQ